MPPSTNQREAVCPGEVNHRRHINTVCRDDTTYRASGWASLIARNAFVEITRPADFHELKFHLESRDDSLGFSQFIIRMIRIP
jgi:hypothetical protein